MMHAMVKRLQGDGFKVVENRPDCVYMARGADNRVVMACGMTKRGQPQHRGRDIESKSTRRR